MKNKLKILDSEIPPGTSKKFTLRGYNEKGEEVEEVILVEGTTPVTSKNIYNNVVFEHKKDRRENTI